MYDLLLVDVLQGLDDLFEDFFGMGFSQRTFLGNFVKDVLAVYLFHYDVATAFLFLSDVLDALDNIWMSIKRG